MTKVTIYLSLKDGVINYRDSEKHKGKTIETSVDPGDKIIWTLDENSGIEDISGINIKGSCKFFAKGPCKKACDKWVAKVNKKAIKKEAIEYEMFVTATESKTKKTKISTKSAKSAKGGDPPKLIIRV